MYHLAVISSKNASAIRNVRMHFNYRGKRIAFGFNLFNVSFEVLVIIFAHSGYF